MGITIETKKAAGQLILDGSLGRQTALLERVSGRQADLHICIPGSSAFFSPNEFGQALLNHPILLAISRGMIRPGAVVMCTSVDRLSRTPGFTEALVDFAAGRGVEIICTFADGSLLDAIRPTYTATALGALCPTEPEVTAALDNLLGSHHRMLSNDVSNNNPALLPVSLPQHNATVLSWVAECERKAGAFATARHATFAGAIIRRLLPARDAGVAAADLLGPEPSRQIGITPHAIDKAKAAMRAIQQHLQRLGLLQVPRPSFEEPWSTAGSLCYRCVRNDTCRCRALFEEGGDPNCPCRCSSCKRAKENLCPCSASRTASMTTPCFCSAACPCKCTTCHPKQPPGGTARIRSWLPPQRPTAVPSETPTILPTLQNVLSIGRARGQEQAAATNVDQQPRSRNEAIQLMVRQQLQEEEEEEEMEKPRVKRPARQQQPHPSPPQRQPAVQWQEEEEGQEVEKPRVKRPARQQQQQQPQWQEEEEEEEEEVGAAPPPPPPQQHNLCRSCLCSLPAKQVRAKSSDAKFCCAEHYEDYFMNVLRRPDKVRRCINGVSCLWYPQHHRAAPVLPSSDFSVKCRPCTNKDKKEQPKKRKKCLGCNADASTSVGQYPGYCTEACMIRNLENDPLTPKCSTCGTPIAPNSKGNKRLRLCARCYTQLNNLLRQAGGLPQGRGRGRDRGRGREQGRG